ncbi:MAG: helix-turn-helix transcriptional regulator [Planctomycetaceae bacterium]|nr:helix-turn-helix transcriptional regulator [Planctomycetaceae bacterium]
MKSPQHFRENLRFALHLRGLSQREFAERAMLSHPYVNRVLVGKVDPSLVMCDQMADALKFDLSDMLKPPHEFKASCLQELAAG